MQRDYLVFVRAGNNSLHNTWIKQDTQRNWDCCVSWYCNPKHEGLAEHYHNHGVNKFDAFHDWYKNNRSTRDYRYYLIIDDDIEFYSGDISLFFQYCSNFKTYLSQPALKLGTYANHHVTLVNTLFLLRTVTFIEVMCPCFSQQALRDLLHTFLLTKSTWGLDYIWASLLKDTNSISIIDAIQVKHTKPVDTNAGAFYQYMQTLGVCPEKDYAYVKKNYPSFNGMRTKTKWHKSKYPRVFNSIDWVIVRISEKYKKIKHLDLLGSRDKP